MRGGRVALAATLAAGLLTDLPGMASSQVSLAQFSGDSAAQKGEPAQQQAPAEPTRPDQTKPPEVGAPTQPPEAGAPKQPPEVGAPKREDGVAKSRMVSILGREVTNREGDGGRVIDVLVDLDGNSGAVVVEFGGFMGIGSRKVAVDWGALRFVREGNRTQVVVDISREQIRDAAEYKPGETPKVLGTK